MVGTEFIPTADDGRLSVNLELPIGTRVEIADSVTADLTALWREKYPEIEALNYTTGQASSDNTFASLSENGPHIVSMNIRLSDPGLRDRTVMEIADMMRADLIERYPQYSKTQVSVGGGGAPWEVRAHSIMRYMAMISLRPTLWPVGLNRSLPRPAVQPM